MSRWNIVLEGAKNIYFHATAYQIFQLTYCVFYFYPLPVWIPPHIQCSGYNCTFVYELRICPEVRTYFQYLLENFVTINKLNLSTVNEQNKIYASHQRLLKMNYIVSKDVIGLILLFSAELSWLSLHARNKSRTGKQQTRVTQEQQVLMDSSPYYKTPNVTKWGEFKGTNCLWLGFTT